MFGEKGGLLCQLKSKVPEHSSKLGEKRKREGVMCVTLVIGQTVSCAPALRVSTDPSHTWKWSPLRQNTSVKTTGG